MAPSTLDREISTRREAPVLYAQYLQSSAWRTKRNRALRLAKYRCQRCGTKRDPNVHHKTYERVGHELDDDLEVLCFTCHNEHHRAEATAAPETPRNIYVLLVSEAVKATPMAQVADISDDVKRLCLARKIAVDVPAIDRAIALVCATRLKDGGRAYESPVQPKVYGEPLTHAQSVEMLARLRAALNQSAASPKTMPEPKLVTQGQVDKMRAFAMVMAEIAAASERCEALEHAQGNDR